MKFDLQTLSVLVAVSSLVFSFASFTVSKLIRSELALRDWAIGSGLAALSTFLVGMRGLVPEVISAAIANTFLIVGFIFLYSGTRGILRRPKIGKWIWVVVPITLLFLGWFTIVESNVTARVAIISFVASPILFLMGYEFWLDDRSRGKHPLRAFRRLTVSICLLGSALFALRFMVFSHGSVIQDYYSSNSFLLVAPYVWAILFNVWFAIAVTLIVSSHLLSDLTVARDAAEEASVSKGQFLANMSHEIRTPMNAILGLLKLLQSTELTAHQHDYASKTESAAKSLLGLLNDILDFSKVDAGKMSLESEPIRIDQLMRNLSVLLSANVGNKDIDVLFDIDSTLPQVVLGDEMRLQQILVNLGGNAVKFTTTGQVVIVLQKIAESENAVSIRFAVVDTGIGIAPEHQKHIFKGFSQAEGSTTRRFGGTGLGLAISKRFVELMGGDIEIVSTPEVGSTFSFTLEMSKPKDDVEAGVDAARPSVAPERVLVVDDNPVSGELTLRMVRSWGWTADLAMSGMQALEMIASNKSTGVAAFPYPAIYMDWKMADLDGWETTRRIREWAKLNDLAQPLVVMISGHGRELLALSTEAEQEMINGFLVKPVTASMLFDALMDAKSENTPVRKIAKGRNNSRQLLGMRILVVEDNLINQQVAEELLSAQGAIVSLAANGQLGIEAVTAAAPQFDVVLMDVQMPVLDGYDATRILRKELGFIDLPIVAMTANAMASDRAACIAAGMNEHIGKPFDMGKLVSLLIRLTGIQPSSVTEEDPAAALTDIPVVPEIAGLDLQTALDRMSGMESLYVRTARDFVRIMESVGLVLRQHLKDGDKQRAKMLMHTLKGNAGTLGASELAVTAARLEKLCATDEGILQCAEELGDFELLLRSTQTLLNEAIVRLDQPNTIEKTRVEGALSQPVSEATISALNRIAHLANTSDLEALQEFAQARELLTSLPIEQVDALDLALQELNLELAGTLCDQMLSTVHQ